MTTAKAGGNVQLIDLVKRYDDVVAVAGIDLEIPAGEFFSLLGPSGCGKTSTLRLIAGFERPTSGRILLDGRDMVQTPPHKRNVNTVFQNYALFPHLSVADNVGFGLRFQKTARAEAEQRIQEALRLVRLEGLHDRRPNQLSGGQQQRVALARALILNPSVLLLDEPLGALDAQLRKALQIELKSIQEEVGITFVYVTHDQEEALTMSDRMAVMSEGHVEQTGTPEQVYQEPDTAYVASFLGVSNLMEAHATGKEGAGCGIRLGDFSLVAGRGDTGARGPVRVVVRPERVLVHERDQDADNSVPGMIQRVVFVGSITQLVVTLASGETIQSMIPNRGDGPAYAQGTPVSVELPADALRVLRASPGAQPASQTPDSGGIESAPERTPAS